MTRLLIILALLLPLSAHAGEDITGGMWKLQQVFRNAPDQFRIVKCTQG